MTTSWSQHLLQAFSVLAATDTTMHVWTTTMCARTLLMRVCCVCYVCVCVCGGGLCLCVLEPHIFAFYFVLCFLLLYHVCVTPSLKLSSSLLCGSYGTTAVAHQALSFVAATDGASVRACACHVSYRNEHIISREVQGCCAAGRYKPTLPRDFESKHAATVTTTAAVQQEYNITSGSNSGL